MTSVDPLLQSEKNLDAIFIKINEIISALAETIRDDDTLTDCAVRIRNLHNEVKSYIETGQDIVDAVVVNAGSDATPGSLIMFGDDECGDVKDFVMATGRLLGRCHSGTGHAEPVIIGDGFAITENEDDTCTLTTASGRNFFVKNEEFDNVGDEIEIPQYISSMQYQLTGGGSSACKTTNLALSCSGGSGETQIGTLPVVAGDLVRVVIPAAVGASLTTDAANIAGGDCVIYINGVEKVRAKGGTGGHVSNSTSFTIAGGSGGTKPTGMASWNGGVGRRDSAGTAFGAGVREIGSGCGGNVSSASGAVTAAATGFVILRY